MEVGGLNTPQSSLEERVETLKVQESPEIKPITPMPGEKIPDPWKYEIDEIENIAYGGR